MPPKPIKRRLGEIYEPHKEELYREQFMEWYSMHPSFAKVLASRKNPKYDLTEKLEKLFRNITDPNRPFISNLIINLSGLTGSGKSQIGMSIGKHFFPHFTWKNVMFFDNQILEECHKFPKSTLLIRDENPSTGIFGEGSMRTASQLALLVEVSRKAGLNILFIEPSYVKSDLAKLIFETVDMDLKHRITRVAVRDVRSEKYIGAFYVKVLPEDDHDWVQYNLAKDFFIQNIKEGKFEGAKGNPETIAIELLKEIDLEVYLNKKERQIFVQRKFPSYTNGEIRTIATLMEIKIREAKNSGIPIGEEPTDDEPETSKEEKFVDDEEPNLPDEKKKRRGLGKALFGDAF